jgi:hypothetical protein
MFHALALATLLAAPTSSPPPRLANAVHLGLPWISIELPVNPMNPSYRGAFLLVHTYFHQQITRELVQGRAVGMVRGERRTLELEFDRTDTPGVLALRKSWPSEGSWVLAIQVGPPGGSATALVTIGADGTVRGVRVPTQERDGQVFPRQVADAELDAELRTVAAR